MSAFVKKAGLWVLSVVILVSFAAVMIKVGQKMATTPAAEASTATSASAAKASAPTVAKAAAGTPNDAAVASAHILSALPAGTSASVEASTTVGDAAVIREIGKLPGGNFTMTLANGKTVAIKEVSATPAKAAPTPTVKVEVVGGGSIPVTGGGTIAVAGKGSIPVTASGSIPVTGSGTIEVAGKGKIEVTGTGKINIDGKTLEVCRDASGNMYYMNSAGVWNRFP